LETTCTNLQAFIVEILLGNENRVFRPNYVASFGNTVASKDNIDDFIEITNPLPAVVSLATNCFSILLLKYSTVFLIKKRELAMIFSQLVLILPIV
jgi:hypothetical protein